MAHSTRPQFASAPYIAALTKLDAMTAFARRSAYSSARECLTVQEIRREAPSPSAAIFFANVSATSYSAL